MNTLEKLKLIKSGKLTAEENIKRFLEKIEKENKEYNIILTLNNNALNEAVEVDKKIKLKKSGRLAGLGILVKSNICVKGLETNCASKTLQGWIAPYDATAIKKIKEEGGIILGMTNMDEFACGASGETSAFGASKNPLNKELIPGGSSSGSAVAVALEFCDFALGSDTGGSIRNPASHCGVVGVKPSYGLVSRYGLIDLAMSFDQIGIIAKDIETCSFVLNLIKGEDNNDPTTFNTKEIKIKKPERIKVGLLKGFGDEKIEELIDSKTKEISRENKWSMKEVKLKYIDIGLQTYYIIVYAEFFSGTRKFDGRRFGKKIEDSCGEEVLRRILGGSEITKAEYGGRYYKKALEVKGLIANEFEKAFKEFDCIISPTVPKLPHKLGTQITTKEMYNYDVLTVPANIAGICAVSIPAGKINGIPIGLQIMCPKFSEGKLFSIAKEFK
ncbi:MAG: Asp-tRNA(Asn)/Glu-tRNA(Gln) amidotransferase subunit GatA [Candidatus Pacearchaeota archaeon]